MSDVNITVSTIPINIEVNTDPTVFITAAVGGVQPPVQSMSGYLTSGETQDLFLTSGEASLLYYGIDNPFGYITDTGNQDISGTKNFLGNLQLNGNSVLTGEYVLVGGNSLGNGLVLGTNDSYDLNFETNSTVRMTITTGGSVGIGISSATPTSKLQVSGSSGENLVRIQGTGSIEGLFVSSAGNVGINTIAPTQKLEVAGQVLTQTINVTNNGRLANIYFGQRGNSTIETLAGTGSYLNLQNSDSESFTLNSRPGTTNAYSVFTFNATPISPYSGNLYSFQKDSTGVFVISSSGKVGIGATIPVYDLDVVGSGSFSNNLLVSGAMGIGGAANNATEKLGIKYGHVRFTSVPVPAAPTVALAGLGSGNLINDSYQYAISFVTNMGETAFGSFSSYGVVTDYTTDGQIRLTNIPTGTTPGVTYVRRNIYRRHLVDPQGFWMYYITGLNDNTTTTWVDNVNLGIGTSLPPQSDGLADTSTAVFYKNNNKAITIASNSSFGELALRDAGSNTAFNNAVGANALLALKTGRYNQAFGNYTISSFVNGDANHAFGNGVLQYFVNGGGNIGMGYSTMGSLRSGDDNIAIGHRTCSMFQGVGNIAIGSRSIGDSAVPIGTNTNMLYNTAIGYLAGSSLVTGASRNVFLGSYAGRYEGGSNTLIIDSFDRSTSGASISGALIYGKFNNTASSQTLTLGGGGNVGINTSSPVSKLDVSGAISAASLNATGMVSASQYGSIFASLSSVGGLITLSFLTGDHFVTISSGGNYTVTGINIPSGNVVLSTSAFIYNTGYTGALAFPSDWTFMGSIPSSLVSGKSSTLDLKSYGTKIIASYSIQS